MRSTAHTDYPRGYIDYVFSKSVSVMLMLRTIAGVSASDKVRGDELFEKVVREVIASSRGTDPATLDLMKGFAASEFPPIQFRPDPVTIDDDHALLAIVTPAAWQGAASGQ